MSKNYLLVLSLFILMFLSAPRLALSIDNETIELSKPKPSSTAIKEIIFAIPSTQFGSTEIQSQDVTEELPESKKSRASIIDTTINVPDMQSGDKKSMENKKIKDQESYGKNAIFKFGNGLIDITTSWLEIPKSMINTSKNDGLMTGLTVGFAKGIANTAGKALSGAANVVSFPVPVEIKNPMKAKDSGIEDVNMEDIFGSAFSKPSKLTVSDDKK